MRGYEDEQKDQLEELLLCTAELESKEKLLRCSTLPDPPQHHPVRCECV